MKTTYLLNKKQPDGSVCLTVSTSGEWMEVVRNNANLPLNQRRYFILDYIADHDDLDRMVIEVSIDVYRVWHREHMAAQRIRKEGKKYLCLSADANVFHNGEVECVLDTLAGACQVEETVCDHLLLEQLRMALEQWKPWGNDVLDLYLSGNKRHGTQFLAEKYHVSLQVARKYKRQFEKFVKIFILGVSF